METVKILIIHWKTLTVLQLVNRKTVAYSSKRILLNDKEGITDISTMKMNLKCPMLARLAGDRCYVGLHS